MSLCWTWQQIALVVNFWLHSYLCSPGRLIFMVLPFFFFLFNYENKLQYVWRSTLFSLILTSIVHIFINIFRYTNGVRNRKKGKEEFDSFAELTAKNVIYFVSSESNTYKQHTRNFNFTKNWMQRNNVHKIVWNIKRKSYHNKLWATKRKK